MGALGTRRVHELMRRAGLQPIELERYSRSNKIWSTKVKRLRLPDLLCVKTGLRVEVRAKSNLAIKMSDAETNPARRWNSGLAPTDLIAFVLVREGDIGRLLAADNAEFFWVKDLVATEAQSRLGPPKSAGEGAERDREWPSIVPKANGVVQAIANERIATLLQGGRRQSYALNGKNSYFAATEPFLADSQFLAGVPPHKALLPNPATIKWDPRALLQSFSPIDRYVAIKALGVVGTEPDIALVAKIAEGDPEGRVALEAAVALARLGDERGLVLIQSTINQPKIDFLRMEAVLALSEFRNHALAPRCAAMLVECARNESLVGDEVRQAAIWGLGKDGLRTYQALLSFIDAPDINERVHAINAFGSDCSADVTKMLASILVDTAASAQRRSSASFILGSAIPPEIVAPWLVSLSAHSDKSGRNWVLATLGQMNPTALRPYIINSALVEQLEPLQLFSPQTNWTRSDTNIDLLAFVRKQTVDLDD